ncbi:Hypothetical protein R9X50_00007900 [Acrodontium crateriforme]|uniref:RNA-binding S4 domain-containing protein n=1 Tax=Acrodontium crateriforme TaxID=150365 RepID=A0AAQ3R1U1_9PEZI|nr:Hypothetical protein R9X50_00007900 [Acrodontium crateriforme]
MPRRYHGLKKIKVRQDWSRETLYNLSRLQAPRIGNRTFFQQKWTAKSLMRGYHNPYVREGTWTRMFDRRLPAVVPMDHRYLARYDGSEMTSGRGRGRQEPPKGTMNGEEEATKPQATPYMQMTFGPLERRLDTAIWRALFSSSVKQARQFVVHGWVKVNGKKMTYPGYQLNPGDMFQVDPERVMYATGARKITKDSSASDQDFRAEDTEIEKKLQEREAAEDEANGDSEAGAATLESAEEREAMSTAPEDEPDAKKAMKNLITRAKRILDESKQTLSGKRQQELRAFAQSVKKTMSKHRNTPEGEAAAEETIDTMETALAEIMTKIPTDIIPTQTTAEEGASKNPQAEDAEVYAARKDAELLHAALERARANPVDASKPYATPWKPRDYMSAFAFIPRYLEVNQNICSAVYLRHPVARPGLAEVPTPFNSETAALAFNWYLRRR